MAALDFGAGNGMIGEQLEQIGFGTIVGVDLLPEAKAAALRDRPDVYDDYRAADLTALNSDDRTALQARDFDCLSCVAALGFGDVPQLAFAEAFNLVGSPGWLAFNVRDRIFDEEHPDSFGALIERMLAEGVIEERARRSYTHRVSIAGEPLEYVAMVATKRRDIPRDWVGEGRSGRARRAPGAAPPGLRHDVLGPARTFGRSSTGSAPHKRAHCMDGPARSSHRRRRRALRPRRRRGVAADRAAGRLRTRAGCRPRRLPGVRARRLRA